MGHRGGELPARRLIWGKVPLRDVWHDIRGLPRRRLVAPPPGRSCVMASYVSNLRHYGESNGLKHFMPPILLRATDLFLMLIIFSIGQTYFCNGTI